MIQFFKVTGARWATRLARTLLVQLRGVGAEGADNAAEPVDDVEVLQPMGLRAGPVLRGSLEVVGVELGDERIALFLIDKSRQGGAVEPEAGGTILHSLAAQACMVYCRASGRLEITAAPGQDVAITTSGAGAVSLTTGGGDVHVNASGGNVVFNGGSIPVAKEGSATTGHTHAFALTAGPYAVAGTIAVATDTIATGAGSPTVKVP